MGINRIQGGEQISVREVRSSKTKENNTQNRIEHRKEYKKLQRTKLNDMKIKDKQIKSSDEARKQIKDISKKIRSDKSSLKVMDRIDEIREKALATLS